MYLTQDEIGLILDVVNGLKRMHVPLLLDCGILES